MQVVRIFVLFALASTSLAYGQDGSWGDAAIAVETDTVETTTLESTVKAIGTLTAEASATLRAEEPGQILAVHFREGEPLEKGAKLYSIEATVLETEVNEARANVNRSEAALARAEELHTKQLISGTDYDAARANYDVDVARLRSSRARLELSSDNSRFRARFNGRNAVPLGVVKQAVANPLDISLALQDLLPRISQSLPEGMKVEIAHDSTVFIDRSIREVYITVAEAALLVIFVIFLFLRNWRAVLIPLVTIPVSLVVDDAIVMLENIYRHIESGMEPLTAAFTGSREVAFAIMAMTVTLAAVYLPFAFSTGRSGKLFVEFALTLAGAVLVSGFVALTLSPMMCSKLLHHEEKHGRFFEIGERFLHALDRGYHSTLSKLLDRRWPVVGGAGLVIIAMVALFTTLPEELAPAEDQGSIIGIGSAPEGATIDYTDRYAQQLVGILAAQPESRRYFSFSGFNGVTNTITFVTMDDWRDRDRSTQQIQNALFGEFGGITGIMAFPATSPPLGVQDFGQPVRFVVQSTLTWSELDAMVQRLIVKIRENPNLTNPNSDLKLNKPELRIDVNREKISAVGASVVGVGRTLETMLGGRNVTRFKIGSEQYDVIVQVEDDARRTPGDLSSIFVRGANNSMIQLQNLATVTETVAAKELNHFNKMRSATISVGLGPGYSMGEAIEWLESALAEVAPDALYDLDGQSREFRESGSGAFVMMALALMFIYLVLSAQFESFIDPLIILVAVPLAMFGAFLCLAAINLGNDYGWWQVATSWNIYTQIGAVTLVGLISKHGILIVEFSNQLRESGMAKHDAVLQAASRRGSTSPDRLGHRRWHEFRHNVHVVCRSAHLPAVGRPARPVRGLGDTLFNFRNGFEIHGNRLAVH